MTGAGPFRVRSRMSGLWEACTRWDRIPEPFKGMTAAVAYKGCEELHRGARPGSSEDSDGVPINRNQA